VNLGVLLELAKRTELSVQDLALLTKARLTSVPLFARTKPVPGQSLASATAKGLSPIAAKVQSVQRGMALCQTEVHGPVTEGGVPQRLVTVSQKAPELYSMAEARTGASLNQGGLRASWGSRGAHVEEQALATAGMQSWQWN
jgi:hypothetical protein